jgi:hypothetical protein
LVSSLNILGGATLLDLAKIKNRKLLTAKVLKVENPKHILPMLDPQPT